MILAGLFILVAAPTPAAPSADAVTAQMLYRWVPACDTIERVSDLTAIVRLDAKGFVKGDIVMVDRRTGLVVDPARPQAASPGAISAAERAKKAIVAGQPYRRLPPSLVGQALKVDYSAQSACS